MYCGVSLGMSKFILWNMNLFFFFWGSNALILGLEMLFWRLRFGIPLRQDYSREFIMRAAKREVKERGMWILQLRIERSLVLLLRHL